MAWYRNLAHRFRKQDLAGIPLLLDMNKPPTQIGGKLGNMLSLEVIDERNNKRYKILVTEQDLEEIVEIYDKKGVFTFSPATKEEPFGRAAEIVKKATENE